MDETRETPENQRAFATFRVLNEDADQAERDHLMRNLAQLFTFVSDRCDDEQVAQYDEALCKLADIVQIEARAHVATLLAPLERAPGAVVLKLATDIIEVAAPLLEFSDVLSDDDLIEIAEQQSEDHRVAIAGRKGLGGRVGEAIVAHGTEPSVTRLLRNAEAELSRKTVERIATLAAENHKLAHALDGRHDIDWGQVRAEVSAVGVRALGGMGYGMPGSEGAITSRIQTVAYNRLKNHAGFSAQEWKLAWNQVKALADRGRFDLLALNRFTRFGYGHHTAAGLTMILEVRPEIVVKWLAMQDYVALTVAARALGFNDELFRGMVGVLPWRDRPTQADVDNVCMRYKALSEDEAAEIFALWRRHSFRKPRADA